MTGTTATGFEIDREFDAPPETVFGALTQAESFSQWFGGRAVTVPLGSLHFEARTGASWSAIMTLPDGNTMSWAGEFVEVTPPSTLRMTMTDNPEDPARAPLLFKLSAREGGTLMHFEQESPQFSTEQREMTLAGWQTFFDVIDDIVRA